MIGLPKKQALIHRQIKWILMIGHIRMKLHNTRECRTHNEHFKSVENMLNSLKEDVIKVRSQNLVVNDG